MEDGLNLFERGRKLDVLKNENNLKKIMQPETIKSKDNGCGTAPGNLVFNIYWTMCPIFIGQSIYITK